MRKTGTYKKLRSRVKKINSTSFCNELARRLTIKPRIVKKVVRQAVNGPMHRYKVWFTPVSGDCTMVFTMKGQTGHYRIADQYKALWVSA